MAVNLTRQEHFRAYLEKISTKEEVLAVNEKIGHVASSIVRISERMFDDTLLYDKVDDYRRDAYIEPRHPFWRIVTNFSLYFYGKNALAKSRFFSLAHHLLGLPFSKSYAWGEKRALEFNATDLLTFVNFIYEKFIYKKHVNTNLSKSWSSPGEVISSINYAFSSSQQALKALHKWPYYYADLSEEFAQKVEECTQFYTLLSTHGISASVIEKLKEMNALLGLCERIRKLHSSRVLSEYQLDLSSPFPQLKKKSYWMVLINKITLLFYRFKKEEWGFHQRTLHEMIKPLFSLGDHVPQVNFSHVIAFNRFYWEESHGEKSLREKFRNISSNRSLSVDDEIKNSITSLCMIIESWTSTLIYDHPDLNLFFNTFMSHLREPKQMYEQREKDREMIRSEVVKRQLALEARQKFQSIRDLVALGGVESLTQKVFFHDLMGREIWTTKLHEATRLARDPLYEEMFRYILSLEGLDVNVQDSVGDTPLHLAVRENNDGRTGGEVGKLLRAHPNIDLTICNKDKAFPDEAHLFREEVLRRRQSLCSLTRGDLRVPSSSNTNVPISKH